MEFQAIDRLHMHHHPYIGLARNKNLPFIIHFRIVPYIDPVLYAAQENMCNLTVNTHFLFRCAYAKASKKESNESVSMNHPTEFDRNAKKFNFFLPTECTMLKVLLLHLGTHHTN